MASFSYATAIDLKLIDCGDDDGVIDGVGVLVGVVVFVGVVVGVGVLVGVEVLVGVGVGVGKSLTLTGKAGPLPNKPYQKIV